MGPAKFGLDGTSTDFAPSRTTDERLLLLQGGPRDRDSASSLFDLPFSHLFGMKCNS